MQFRQRHTGRDSGRPLCAALNEPGWYESLSDLRTGITYLLFEVICDPNRFASRTDHFSRAQLWN